MPRHVHIGHRTRDLFLKKSVNVKYHGIDGERENKSRKGKSDWTNIYYWSDKLAEVEKSIGVVWRWKPQLELGISTSFFTIISELLYMEESLNILFADSDWEFAQSSAQLRQRSNGFSVAYLKLAKVESLG